MDDSERALAPYTNGSRAIVEGTALRPILATPAAEAHILAWTRDQARKAGHEAGHLAVAALCGVVSNSISIKSGWGGKVELSTDEDTESVFETVAEKRSLITIAFAGLESERALFAEPTDGSLSDISKAAKIAAELIACGAVDEFRMTPLKLFGYEIDPPQAFVAEAFELVEDELRAGRARARSLVAANKTAILELSRLVFAARRMDAPAIDAALSMVGLPVPERRA